MKGCQFLNGLQLKNDTKDNLRTSRLNKDLSQIEYFQCCLSIQNSNCDFTLKINDCALWNKRAGEN